MKGKKERKKTRPLIEYRIYCTVCKEEEAYVGYYPVRIAIVGSLGIPVLGIHPGCIYTYV
jgi:hypothetical protein